MKIAIDFDNTLTNLIISVGWGYAVDGEAYNEKLITKMREWKSRNIPMGIVTFRKYTYRDYCEIKGFLKAHGFTEQEVPIHFCNLNPKTAILIEHRFTHIIDDMHEVKKSVEENSKCDTIFIYTEDEEKWLAL